MTRSGGWLIAAVLVLAAHVSAQTGDGADEEEPTYGATGVASRPIASGNELDPTASSTVIRLDARPRAVETLDEVLLDSPGARARRSGGFGGFTTLSLRGAEAEQTTVLLGEIPIASPDGSAFDLSSIPTWLLSRVEVYRGGAPTWLSAGAIGGVLRLVPRDDPGQHFEGTLSAGSFDLGQLRASASVGDDRLHVTTAAGGTTYGGQFPYVDDNHTSFDPSDDVTRVRLGTNFLEGSGMMSVRGRIGDVRLESAWLGTERVGGLAAVPSRFADVPAGRRSSTRLLGGVSAELADRDVFRLALALGVGFERRTVSDPLAQFGQLARDTDDLLWRATARLAGTVRAADWLDVTAVGTYAHEALSPSDRLALRQPPASARDGAVIALEGRAFGAIDTTRFEVRPSGRVEILDARLFDLSEGRSGAATSSTLFVPTARLGFVLEPIPGVAISASGYAAVRPPSLVELFGDRAYLVGNTTLRAETSLGVDGGLLLTGSAGPVRGTIDVRGFGAVVSDLIRYARNTQNQSVPLNVASATLAGIEASVAGSVDRWAHLNVAFTWLHAEDETLGRALPLRPPVSLYARFAATSDRFDAIDRIAGFADVEYVAASYADQANTEVIAGRARVGIGASVTFADRHVSLEVVVRDLFDARGTDILGLPLAGRSVIGSLTLRE